MIKLTPLKREDLAKIVLWNEGKSSDYLLQWAGPKFTYPLTFTQIENYFLTEIDKENSNIFIYKILHIDTEEMIGTVELREVDKDNRIGKVCRFLIGEKNNRGKGLGEIVLNEILRIGFEDKEFEKITLGVFDFNDGAIRCYEKVGFIKENFLENVRKSSTGYWNLYEMSISKDKWKIKSEM